MNKAQIKLNESVIRKNREEIARIELELQNPRIRNIEGHKEIIKGLKIQIAQAESFLSAA